MIRWFLLLFSLVFMFSCEKQNSNVNSPDLTFIPHNPQALEIESPEFFGEMVIPENNPLTQQGVRLGRFLFYDPILSQDSSMSCASCHIQEKGFADGKTVSQGVSGSFGSRNSMSLANIGYANNDLFWDGRVKTLEEQALHPVENPVELNEVWENVESKLQRHALYPKMFRQAFPIESKVEITKDLVAKALAQFERTIISSNTRYDKAVSFEEPSNDYSQEELDGYFLFFQEIQNADHPGCHHCHAPPIFGAHDYFNNGLEEAPNMTEFSDLGLGAINLNLFDNGKFKAPSLRNIEFTAPYMHDGRFETLEEVIDHYSSGGHYSPNLDANITGFELSDYQKSALVAFLKSLSDHSLQNNPDYSNPFE